MTLFSLSPNANANFPDRFRRRLRALTQHELSPLAASGSIEISSVPDGHEFPATGSDPGAPGGDRVYASKFKADLTSLMSVTRREEESESARVRSSATPGLRDPVGDPARADDILGHLAALLASARSGDTAAAKGAAASLQAATPDGGGVSLSAHSDGVPRPSPSIVIVALQSLISAASSGDIEAARVAARNWARELQSELAGGPRARPSRPDHEGILEAIDPGAKAAYETLMEFTQGGVATAA